MAPEVDCAVLGCEAREVSEFKFVCELLRELREKGDEMVVNGFMEMLKRPCEVRLAGFCAWTYVSLGLPGLLPPA